jgi:predicted metal-binding protein
MEREWIEKALEVGFDQAVPLDVTKLIPRQDIRAMCAADQCRAYGKNWTCPPYCGSVEECAAKIRGYSKGVLLQTVGRLEKTIDTKSYRCTEQRHMEQFHCLAKLIRQEHPDALCLGSGGCSICEKCAWPEVCRFPEDACSSMEAFGLFVTQVCRDHGVPYYHGERTITYTACILIR